MAMPALLRREKGAHLVSPGRRSRVERGGRAWLSGEFSSRSTLPTLQRRALQRWPDPLTVVARRAKACTSIDVRRWHREGLLRAGQYFSWSWTRGGEPAGSIGVRPEWDAVVLIYRS